MVDISGFTTLSEQLAAAGREGTEQLIATLSRIFTVLLPATDDGGDVVKFAGDALFVLFSGPDHARHAAHAAWNMNRVLTAIGDIHLPSARARLRMSVGVHTGVFDFFLTGDDSVSVVLTGRDTTRVLELQSAADAGRILVSDETAAHLPSAQVAKEESAPGARRLLRAGTVVAASLMALSVGRTAAAERFLPRAFAQRPDLLASEPDHRWAAIAFVQVAGVADEPGPDDMERMQRLTRVVEEAAADTGVTLLDVDPAGGGYRFFLTAGAPTTVEDPEGRLLTAVLRIVDSGSAQADGWSLRAGVTSGRVFAGFVGAMYRQTYTVMGDPTNLAARLASRADPGTVLAARSVLDRTSRPFESDDAGTITVKGKTQDVPVAVVTGSAGRVETVVTSAPFRGRVDELRRLVALRESAADGFGGAVTVVAPAGTGKSRLIEQALEGTRLPIYRAAGDRYAMASPYRALQSLLRPLLDIAADIPADEAGERLARAVANRRPALTAWLPLLAPAFGADVPSTDEVDGLADEFRQDRAHAVLRRLLDDLLPTPACIVIEDAHWVDTASADALAAVLGGDIPHAVFLTRRDVEGGLELPGQRIELAGLSDDEATELVDSVLGRPLLPSDLYPILRRAEGNPLYLIELAAGLSNGSETLGIEQLVGERIDALPDQERTLLRRASVLGWAIPAALFVRCVGPAELAETGGIGAFLERLDDDVHFRHDLFREVAYEQLNFQTRRELHRAAAAVLAAEPALAGGPVAPMLMVHYDAAGDWEHAREAAAETAEAAEADWAIDDAVRAWRVAIAAAGHVRPPPPDLPELWSSLGRACVFAARSEEAVEAFTQGRRVARGALERARFDRERAHALALVGRPAEAESALKAAARVARAEGDARLLGTVLVRQGLMLLRQAHWSELRATASEAIALLEGAAESREEILALGDAYRYHDIAASELEGDDAMAHVDKALDLYRQVNDPGAASKVLSLLGVRAYYRGDWSAAVDLYREAGEAATAAGAIANANVNAANVAEILIDQGRVDEALSVLRPVLRIFRAGHETYLAAFATGFLGRAAHRSGDLDSAKRFFDEAAAEFAALGEADSEVDVRVRRLEADLDGGDRDAARAGIEALMEYDTRASGARLLRVRARLARLDGDDRAARGLADEAVSSAADSRFERALSLALVARLSGDAADAAIAEASAVFAELGVVDIDRLLDDPASDDHTNADPEMRAVR